LKLSVENCCETAADDDMITMDSLYRKLLAPNPMVPSPTPYDLPFSHNTARLTP